MPEKHGQPLVAFVHEVTATLLAGHPHKTHGLGTFSTCTRRATPDRCVSTMAMFRASAELRAYASGGPLPSFSGPHASALRTIVRRMLREEGITVPRLGRMAAVPVAGSKPKIIFHGAMELNAAFAKLATQRPQRSMPNISLHSTVLSPLARRQERG